MSDEIESVREHVGRSFTVAPEGAEPVELALTELRDLASSTRDGGGYALTWKGPSAPLLPIGYSAAHRLVAARGVAYVPDGSTRRRVTHAGRARHIQERAASGETDQQIADALHISSPAIVAIYRK